MKKLILNVVVLALLFTALSGVVVSASWVDKFADSRISILDQDPNDPNDPNDPEYF